MSGPIPPFLNLSLYKSEMAPAQLAVEILRQVTDPVAGPVTVSVNPPLEEFICQDNHEASIRFQSLGSEKMVVFETVVIGDDQASPVAWIGNWNPIAFTPVVDVSLDGSCFSTSRRPTAEIYQAQKVRGHQAYIRFLDLCKSLSPTYASIWVESALQSPSELVADADSMAFSDFFLGEELGERLIAEAERICFGAYIERTGNGLYVSTYRWFNPAQSGMAPKESQEIGGQISRLLTAHFGRA